MAIYLFLNNFNCLTELLTNCNYFNAYFVDGFVGDEGNFTKACQNAKLASKNDVATAVKPRQNLAIFRNSFSKGVWKLTVCNSAPQISHTV